MSSAERWRLGAELRRHARTVRPEGPSLADVTVLAGPIPTARLVDELRQHGFELRAEGTPAFIDQTRVYH